MYGMTFAWLWTNLHIFDHMYLSYRSILLILILLFVFTGSLLYAQSIPKPVRKVIYHLKGKKKFRAKLEIIRAGSHLEGILSYDNAKLHLRLKNGDVLAMNNVVMIAYDAQTNVAGSHPIDKDLPKGKEKRGGIAWLLKGYNYEINGLRRAVGIARSARKSVQKVLLSWNENFVLQSLHLNPDGKNATQIIISDYKVLTYFTPSLFSYRPPTGSRTVENALRQN